MPLYVNLDDQEIVAQPLVSGAVSEITTPRGQYVPINVQFVRNGAIVDPEAVIATVASSAPSGGSTVFTAVGHGFSAADEVTIAGHSGVTKTITSSTAASPSVITVTAHGYSVGQTVAIAGHSTIADGDYVIASVTTDTFTTGANTSTAGSGGACAAATSNPDVNGLHTIASVTDDTFTVASLTLLSAGTGGTATRIVPMVLRWTIKTDGKFDEDPPLVFLNTFTKHGSGSTTIFKGLANYFTAALNALLGVNPPTTANDVAEVVTMAELSWTGHAPSKANWVRHVIRNDIYKDLDSIPSDTPTISDLIDELLAELPGPLYLATAHTNAGALNTLLIARSRDGRNWTRIGTETPPVFATGIRDPSWFYHAPSRQFVLSFTKAPTPSSFETGLGLIVSTDLITWTQLSDIVITGLTGTHAFTWNGSWFEDNGDLYLLCLPLGSGGDKNTHGIGWMQVANPQDSPADWVFSAFTSLKATNSNWSGANDLNDPHVTRLTNGTYRMVLDGHPSTGADGVLTATSNSPLTGYSAPTLVPGHAAREGAILTPGPDAASWLLFSEEVYGPVQYAVSDDLSTWTTPEDIDWRYGLAMGNGEIARVEDLDAQAAVLAAPEQAALHVDGSATSVSERHAWASYSLYASAAEGNGVLTSDHLLYSLFNDGSSAAQRGVLAPSIVATGFLSVGGPNVYGFPVEVAPASGTATVSIQRPNGGSEAGIVLWTAGGGTRYYFQIPASSSDLLLQHFDGASTFSTALKIDDSTHSVTAGVGDLIVATAGKGVQIKEGGNARMGHATLVGGSQTISNTSVGSNTRIFLTRVELGISSAIGAISVYARTGGVGFVIAALKPDGSVESGDVSIVDWLLIEPA